VTGLIRRGQNVGYPVHWFEVEFLSTCTRQTRFSHIATTVTATTFSSVSVSHAFHPYVRPVSVDDRL